MEFGTIIKRIGFSIFLLLLTYFIVAYFHVRNINEFCIDHSVDYPFEMLAPKIEELTFTDYHFYKGYIEDDIWVQPEFEFTSYFTTKFFSCSIKLGYIDDNPENVVTRGHLVLDEIGYGWLKVKLTRK